jgi:thioredoxin-related protein
MKTVSSLALALLTGTLSALAASGWQTDFTAAQTAAKKDGKAILLDFTGSDWCGWCIKMKKDALDQKAFQEFADKKLVLVEVDFPNNKEQTDEVKKQNEGLQKKYGVEGYPTFVLVDQSGKELGRHVGYLKGGPSAFVQKIEGWTKTAAAK